MAHFFKDIYCDTHTYRTWKSKSMTTHTQIEGLYSLRSALLSKIFILIKYDYESLESYDYTSHATYITV